MSVYPSSYGIVICFDLAYNMVTCYGNWFPGLKELMQAHLMKVLNMNPALFVLRERIRAALQLHSTENKESYISTENYTD